MKVRKENGEAGGDRTRDHKVKSLVLYQLSYRLVRFCCAISLLYTDSMSGPERDREENAQSEPRLSEFTALIFRAANFTVGGGGPSIAILLRELVYKRRWIDETAWAVCFAMARITPGTNMLAFYTAAGLRVKGWRGALAALIAASVPCCVFTALFTAGFARISENRWVQGALAGALAASVGLLAAAFWLLVQPFLKKTNWKSGTLIVVASIVLSLGVGLSPIPVLILAAIAGAFLPVEPAS